MQNGQPPLPQGRQALPTCAPMLPCQRSQRAATGNSPSLIANRAEETASQSAGEADGEKSASFVLSTTFRSSRKGAIRLFLKVGRDRMA